MDTDVNINIADIQGHFNPENILEFQVSDLHDYWMDEEDHELDRWSQQAKLIDTVYRELRIRIGEKMSPNEVIGVTPVPQKRPKTFQILFRNSEMKQRMESEGINLFGTHVDLTEKGQGSIRVEITNAPLWVPDALIKEWAQEFGEVTGFVRENVKIDGRYTSWVTSKRWIFMKKLKSSLPPEAKINIGGKGGRQASFNVWHYGQTHTKCGMCHEVVLKGHVCRNRRTYEKSCFKCGQEGHMQRQCPLNQINDPWESRTQRGGTTLHVIENMTQARRNSNALGTDHGASNVQQLETHDSTQTTSDENRAAAETSNRQATAEPTLTEGGQEGGSPEEEGHGNGTENPSDEQDEGMETEEKTLEGEEIEQADQTGSMQGAMNETRYEDFIDAVEPPTTNYNAVFMGGSNVERTELKGDHEITLNVTKICQGGARIETLANKLDEMSSTERQQQDLVIINVGACNFPAESGSTLDSLFGEYTTLVSSVKESCPNATVIMSSVLPNQGEHKEIANEQIKSFNEQLQLFGDDPDDYMIFFCNNDETFYTEDGKIRSNLLEDDVHVSPKGSKALAESILKYIRIAKSHELMSDSMVGFAPTI